MGVHPVEVDYEGDLEPLGTLDKSRLIETEIWESRGGRYCGGQKKEGLAEMHFYG